MKLCNKCNEHKQEEEFYLRINPKTGNSYRTSPCKKCCTERSIQYGKRNKEKRKEISTRWNLNNADKKNQQNREYIARNKESVLQRQRQWRVDNREKERVRHRIYQEHHKEEHHIRTIKSLKKAIAHLTDNYVKAQIWKKYGLSHSEISEEMVELKRQLLLDHRAQRRLKGELDGIVREGNQGTANEMQGS